MYLLRTDPYARVYGIQPYEGLSGVESRIGIGAQNAGWWYPSVQDWGKTFPTHLCALAAADQNTLPRPPSQEPSQIWMAIGQGETATCRRSAPKDCPLLREALTQGVVNLKVDGVR